MNALNINFIAQRRSPSLIGLALLALGVAYAAVVGMHYSDAQDELDRAQSRQARAQRKEAPQHKPAQEQRSAQDELKSAGRIDAELQRPWEAVLHELETRATPDVAVVQLEMQGQARTFHLTGEAKSMDDVVPYVQGLRQSKVLSEVYLAGHEEKTVGAVTVVRFNLNANWSAAK